MLRPEFKRDGQSAAEQKATEQANEQQEKDSWHERPGVRRHGLESPSHSQECFCFLEISCLKKAGF